MLLRFRNIYFALIFVYSCSGLSAQTTERRTNVGFRFLEIPSNARGTALAGAMVSREGGPEMAGYNVAGMAWMPRSISIQATRAKWITHIKSTRVEVAVRPFNGKFGTLAGTYSFEDYGEFTALVREVNSQEYTKLSSYDISDWYWAISYAHAVGNHLAFGGQIKRSTESLGSSVLIPRANAGQIVMADSEPRVTAYDLGILLRTGWRTLNIGFGLRNLGGPAKYLGEELDLPFSWTVGASIEAIELLDSHNDLHAMHLSIDYTGRRAGEAVMKTGLEYRLFDLITLRLGYYFFDSAAANVEWGLGLAIDKKISLGIDFGRTEVDGFDSPWRIGAHFAL